MGVALIARFVSLGGVSFLISRLSIEPVATPSWLFACRGCR
jgi:hypothetical protein